jgi:hypothetical protein
MSYIVPRYAVFFTSSLLSPNSTSILLKTLFSITLSLCSSLNVKERFSHSYRTKGKIMYSCIFQFLRFIQQTRRQKVLYWMSANITIIHSPLNFLLIQVWFVTVVPKYIFALCHIFKGSGSNLLCYQLQLEFRPLDRPARSQSLHLLCCPGSYR